MTPTTHVRPATVDDAREVAAVLNAVIAEGGVTLFDRPFSPEEEATFISSLSPRSALFVAEVDNTIAGLQSLDLFSNVAPSVAHVATMGTWLRRDVRGQGIGRLLALESFRFAERHGYTKIVVHVLSGNERALRFYRGLGFAPIGIARKQVRLADGFHDEVFLEKLLD